MATSSFLIRTPHHTILIDTCVGDHKPRAGGILPPTWNHQSGGVFLRKLEQAGVRPEDIDFVMCTHLHSDHVGWNTRLAGDRWVPTFPNARYVMSRADLEYTQDLHRKRQIPSLVDSVLPIVEAGQALLVMNDYALDDHVRLESTPGHTPDHVSVRLAFLERHCEAGTLICGTHFPSPSFGRFRSHADAFMFVADT